MLSCDIRLRAAGARENGFSYHQSSWVPAVDAEVLMYLVVSGADEEFRIEGRLSEETLGWLRTRYGGSLSVAERTGTSPAESLVYYRKLNNLSQVDLAGKLGTQKQVICDIEHGRRAISKRMAKALSEVFGADVSVFI